MKKKVFGEKLSRDTDSRNALFRALLRALIIHGSIITTYAKANAIKRDAEKLIRFAKSADFNDKRKISAILANDRETTKKLYETVVATFDDIKSGFIRITNLPRRRGDNARIVKLEWSRKISVSNKSIKGKDKTKSEEAKADKKSLRGRLNSLRKKSVKSVKKSV
ncbi:50S ribosomal protein L17 [Candidatus Woesebacteria bacterium RIFCSPHIGHO2_01_FULL_38_9b]|uniref:50S ribosomal protein L17 n=1 Tax=Candidatus Woesebacteria bacterium RIFCSPHIGHO2_01_FULL_38_9b TaxID=1802493 RepID=A0A1F7Y1W3_9BACT|nr:MAG: 50S ribosomal protein L17 [Candidatus Woesebacteria bacterium RIFCSPHIGHO2_01_FULL_38_9b]